MEEDALVTATGKYITLRKYAPAFLEAFAFKASKARDPVLAALEILREANRKGRGEIPATAPMTFSHKKWKAPVVDGKVDRRRYEVAICATLRDRLRSGDIWIDGTRCQAAVHPGCAPLSPGARAVATGGFAASSGS